MTITDAALAAEMAEAAGALLLELQRTGNGDGKALGKEGDEKANRLLMDALARHRPEDAVLCEEERDSSARLAARRIWIIDPLDGTREFGEGRTDWAVHVALVQDHLPFAGAVALPALGLVLRSDEPTPFPEIGRPLRMLVSRTRPASQAVAVAERLGAELIPMGSAGAKAMAIVRGEADIYLHAGGQYEWDNCAPVAVAQAAGFHASRIDGSPLRYNQPDPYLPDLLLCQPSLAKSVFDALAEVTPNEG